MSGLFPTFVPHRIVKDGWWLSTISDDGGSIRSQRSNIDWRKLGQSRVAVILALILLADWLFWGHWPGISLTIFALALSGSALFFRWNGVSKKTRWVAMTIAVWGALPSIIALSTLSVLFLIGGAIASVLVLNARIGQDIYQNVRALCGFIFTGPFWIIRDTFAVRKVVTVEFPTKRILHAWAIPVGLGLVFLSLFVQANPVFEETFDHLIGFSWFEWINVGRMCFWTGLLCLIWPFLHIRPATSSPVVSRAIGRAAPSWLDQTTIRNALLVFNLLFAMQTGLDVTYLWGGSPLPENMTYAEYAHRGAYPLLATALLAGIFMILATSFETPTPANRILLYVWTLQNGALVMSSVLRLNLYVAFYSLTYLRVAAFIWMGLVAVGLILITIRIAQNRSNTWVISRTMATTTLILYACCFANFASLIGSYNVTHSQEISGEGLRLDHHYLCSLGANAYPAADRYFQETNLIVEGFHLGGGHPGVLLRQFKRSNENWRAWGLRDAGLRRYLKRTYPDGVN